GRGRRSGDAGRQDERGSKDAGRDERGEPAAHGASFRSLGLMQTPYAAACRGKPFEPTPTEFGSSLRGESNPPRPDELAAVKAVKCRVRSQDAPGRNRTC